MRLKRERSLLWNGGRGLHFLIIIFLIKVKLKEKCVYETMSLKLSDALLLKIININYKKKKKKEEVIDFLNSDLPAV